MGPQYYMLDMSYALSSWHKWAKAVYDYAKKYNHYLFTEDGLVDFRNEVYDFAKDLRNFTFIGEVSLGKDCEGWMRAPVGFSVGREFSITFIKVPGYYGNPEKPNNQVSREYYGN